MAMIAWECSSQGKLFLGPDMAELTAANVHLESGLNPVAPELKKKKSLFFSFSVYQPQQKFLRSGR